jgi:hypothetical protein
MLGKELNMVLIISQQSKVDFKALDSNLQDYSFLCSQAAWHLLSPEPA